VKTIIIYESSFGNTKKVAEKIRENLNLIEKNDTVIKTVKEVDPIEVLNFDLILFGSPNHMGGPTRGIRKFIDKLKKVGLKGKKVATFDTYVRKNINKAVRKMERRIKEKIPNAELITPGLSIKVSGVGGPVIETEFPKVVEFIKIITEPIKN
jgi:flavodoxin